LANRLHLLFGMQRDGGNAKTARTESKGGLTTATLRARRRHSSSGTSGVEDLLHYALVMATIVYPLSLGARAAGKALSTQIDTAHSTILTPNGH
jgi:hypothetical protein